MIEERRRPKGRPLVLGHRGARHAAPENTLAAFDLALEEGAHGIELDVRLDGEGDVVVLHDPTLARVTGGADDRAVAALGRRELDAIDVGGGERVPRLVDVLEWASSTGAVVNVELKHDAVDRPRLVRAISRMLRAPREHAPEVILSSFDPLIVAAASRLLPSLRTGWLVHDEQRILKYTPAARFVGAGAIHPQRTLVTPRAMARWKGLGLPIHVWTVNDPAEARRCAALGVDAIITDAPGRIIEALG